MDFEKSFVVISFKIFNALSGEKNERNEREIPHTDQTMQV